MKVTVTRQVIFYSPGPLAPETTILEVPLWSPQAAVRIALSERHRPYGFRFETVARHEAIDDGMGGEFQVVPKVTESSGMYFIDGTVQPLEVFAASARVADRVFLTNMRNQKATHVVTVNNGYLSRHPFNPQVDHVIDKEGRVR